jgi:hypothetical protein
MARSERKAVKRGDAKIVKNDMEEMIKKYIENEEDTALA